MPLPFLYESCDINWLTYFWGWTNLIGLFEFDIQLSKILLTASVNCIDKFFYFRFNQFMFDICKTKYSSKDCKVNDCKVMFVKC